MHPQSDIRIYLAKPRQWKAVWTTEQFQVAAGTFGAKTRAVQWAREQAASVSYPVQIWLEVR